FRNTSLSSLQGDSLAASFASSCEKYPRKSLSTFYLRLVLVIINSITNASVAGMFGCGSVFAYLY
ncbi:MAG: hypothetical protein U0K87_12435, partial [Ruminococcus sp.]|nr:hypothetical protein [Ruminococcus sp.]